MRELRIVHLSTVHPRKDTRIYHRELWSLSQMANAVVTLVVADGEGDVTYTEDNRIRQVIDIGRLPGGRAGRAIIGPGKAVKVVRSLKPDIVHFHDPELIPAALFLKLLGYRIVYDVHEDVPRQILNKHWLPKFLRHPAAWIVKIVEWVGASAFEGIVAATPDIVSRFPRDKSAVVQNFPLPDELNIAEDSIPYLERPHEFVYVGALSVIRGIFEIAKALELMDDELDARVVLAGSFRPEELEEKLFSLPAGQHMNYVGWASRRVLAGLLGRARAGLVVLHPVPNYLDAYPVKMFEYMACGLPVIASDFPLWRSIVEPAACGILVDPEDPKAIADAMTWVLRNPSAAREMGERGQVAVSETYNWYGEADKLLKLYETLLPVT